MGDYARINPNLTAQIGQNNMQPQKVSFGGLSTGGSLGGGKKIGGGDSLFAKEMAEVSQIGAEKAEGYRNGVGGTNYATETTGNRLMLIG